MTRARNDSRRLAWERRTRLPFVVLAFVYLAAWTVVAVDQRSFSPISIAFGVVLLAIWAVFLVDYLVRLALAEDRGRFFVTSVPDLLAAVLPQLRPVVQLRHLTSIPFFASRTGSAQRARMVLLALAFTVIFVYSIALSVLVAERGARDAVILTLGDAVWWACVTMFTVGYGDLYPVTVLGRTWAVALMIGGVGIIGAASAIFVSYLNERIRHPGAHQDPELARPTVDARRDAEDDTSRDRAPDDPGR